MNPLGIMKRFGTVIAVLLVLFVTALPAAAACCVAKPMGDAAAMHAAMPCCGETCQVTKTTASRDLDIALTPSAAPDASMAIAMAVDVADTPAATSRATARECGSFDLAASPSFPLHRQLRI